MTAIEKTFKGNKVDAGRVFSVQVAPTVTAGAYTAHDCIGGEMTITNASRLIGGGGLLLGVSMAAEDNDADGWSANDIDVLLFSENPGGTYTDNAALAVPDADAPLLIGSVLLDAKVDCGDVTLLYARGVNAPFYCSADHNLYAVAVNRGGTTPEATDALTFTFHLLRD